MEWYLDVSRWRALDQSPAPTGWRLIPRAEFRCTPPAAFRQPPFCSIYGNSQQSSPAAFRSNRCSLIGCGRKTVAASNSSLRSKHVKRIQAGRPCGYHTSITVQSARCGHWGRKCAVHPAPQPMPCCPDRHVLQPESGEPQPPGHSGPGGGLSGQGPNWPALQRSSWPQAALPLGCPAAIVPHLPDAGIEQAKSLTHRELSTVLHGNGGKAGEPPRSQAFSKPACRTEMGSAQATHTVTFTGDVPSTRRHSHTPSPCKRSQKKGIK